ncbi:COP9 signalosome complex subunit 8-like [Trifolium pratense]|uniref:COP9 signalosome complex subunit 8-like n=1 Tax=Trifolium pratense TaxID=57577 RepID=UPI001E696F7E|nr:COP9 signalosome complex subunit 8-like [Trifolium pratense]
MRSRENGEAKKIDSARFLWKTIPSSIKESNPEVNAVWKIGQQLWLRNYAGVHEAIRGFEWGQGLQDFVAAFSGKHFAKSLISLVEKIVLEFELGKNIDSHLFLAWLDFPLHIQISNMKYCMIADVLQQGWTVDYVSRMLTVKKQPVVTEQKLDPRKLQQLTEYVFHLEH